MAESSKAEQYLVEQIRAGESDAWSQLVERFQGRLLAFARSRLRNAADAEDVVQESFISFLKSLDRYRQDASLETYLFTILRRKVIDHLRGRKVSVCLMRDAMGGGEQAEEQPFGNMPAADPTASWYARRDEQHGLQRDALGDALVALVSSYKEDLNFRDLEIAEMLFYAQIRNKDVARISGRDEKQVALLKHRWLKQIRQKVARRGSGGYASAASDVMLTEAWEQRRPSCPKRSTIGAYLLGTLEPAWQDYVEFHLSTIGCRFCQANLEDLKARTASPKKDALQKKIMQSTVGFLHKA